MTSQLQSCTQPVGQPTKTSTTHLRQSSHGIWRLLILVLVQRAKGLPAQLQITNRIIALNRLVEIGVKGYFLDILLLTQFHKTFARCITRVEDFLQQIQDQIGGAILAFSSGGGVRVPLPCDQA